MSKRLTRRDIGAGILAAGAASLWRGNATAQTTASLLNVSYDPTRELWRDFNQEFAALYEAKAGVKLDVRQSHGGSSTQARAVIDGLDADIVTLATYLDVDAISKRGLIRKDWVDAFPNRSLPYTSTIVFVVRKDNPKAIQDWSDIVKPGVAVITPNPKTSGNGYLAFFAAMGAVLKQGGSQKDAIDFVTRLYRQVPVLDSGARGSSTTFSQKRIGDVLLTWENEAHLAVREARGRLEIVNPSVSILAEPHVALVDANVDRKKTRAHAQAYLEHCYSPQAQQLFAKHFYRPIEPVALQAATGSVLGAVERFPITLIAPDFGEAHRLYIGDGGVFDTIYRR